jgi:hypothetical protein
MSQGGHIVKGASSRYEQSMATTRENHKQEREKQAQQVRDGDSKAHPVQN